jgi:hypothetical protein
MNFKFATLLGVRAATARPGRRDLGDRLRTMRALQQPILKAAPDTRPASRPRAVWRVSATTGRPVLGWALDADGDGSCRSRSRQATGIRRAGQPSTMTPASGPSHGRLF